MIDALQLCVWPAQIRIEAMRIGLASCIACHVDRIWTDAGPQRTPLLPRAGSQLN
jgi:hypothetical protein